VDSKCPLAWVILSVVKKNPANIPAGWMKPAVVLDVKPEGAGSFMRRQLTGRRFESSPPHQFENSSSGVAHR